MIKVSDYIALRLYELGCKHVFMVTGGGAMHLNDSFARGSGTYDVLYSHHEQASAIAAEGLYRATGKIGVINVTTGPGGLNTLTGVMGQWTDSIPAIYVSGQVKQSTTIGSCRTVALRQLGDQEVDIISIVSPITKYAVSIQDPLNTRFELEKAFSLAVTGRKGPVWIDVPMDIQGALIDAATQRSYIPEDTSRSSFDVGAVVELLQQCERPVIVAGHGVRLSQQIDTLNRILSYMPMPALTTFCGFDLIANDHPCYAGRIGTLGTRGGNFTLQNADCVLCFGTRNNIRQISYNWENFAHKAKTVAVDIDSAELCKPTFCPTLPIHADLAEYLPALESALYSHPPLGDYSAWLQWAKERTQRYPVVLPSHFEIADRIQPYAFFDIFTKLLDRNAVVVAGNGTACVALFQAGIVRQGQRYFWNSGCASMGFDIAAAIGAAQGLKREVWCIAGDGSLQMNLQELATMVHNKMNIKLLVLNNGGYASIRQTQDNFFGAQYGCGPNSGLGFPNFERLASAYELPYICSNQLNQVPDDFAYVSQVDGAVLWEIKLTLDYSFEPKITSKRLPNGQLVSCSLEDMAPFLDRDELLGNMLMSTKDA